MSRDIEQEFEDAIQRAVEELEKIECSQDEYLSGLKSARCRFADMVQMVTREIEIGMGHD